MMTFKKKGDNEAVKKRKELLERIIDNAPSVIIGVNLQNNIMIFNKEAERITGYSKKEALGGNFFSLFIPEEQREEVNAIFNEVKQGGSIYNVETHIITKNGDERLISWCSGEMINVEDRMIGEIYVGSDITDKKGIQTSEESANLAEEDTEDIANTYDQIDEAVEITGPSEEGPTAEIDWEIVFNSIADPITIIGKENVIMWVNNAFARKLNAESEELIGKKCCDVFHDTNSPIHGCVHKKIFETKEAFSEEVYDESSDTTTLISCSPYYDANGELMASILLTKDMTYKESTEERPTDVKKMANQDSLVSAIEHEMNNPLGGVLGNAETIMDEDDPLKIRLYSKEIVDAATRVIKLLDSLRGDSPIPSGFEMVPIDLNDVIKLSLSLMSQNEKFENVEIAIDLHPIPEIKGNPNELQQVFMNLISNALDAMDGKGKMSISTDTSNGHVQAVFKDDGTEIPNEQLCKIFDPFSETERGTGLRMYAVSRTLMKYGAPISVESGSGEGTAFIINFPHADTVKDNA
jgi:PAS domain S-box-containing protein